MTVEVVTQCPRAFSTSYHRAVSQALQHKCMVNRHFSSLCYSYGVAALIVTELRDSCYIAEIKCLQVFLLKQVFPIRNWGSYIHWGNGCMACLWLLGLCTNISYYSAHKVCSYMYLQLVKHHGSQPYEMG